MVNSGSWHFITGSEVYVVQWLAGEPITKDIGAVRSPLDVLLNEKNHLRIAVPIAFRQRRMATDEIVQLRNTKIVQTV